MECKTTLAQWELSLVTNTVHTPGVLAVPFLVFQEFLVVVLTEQDRVLSVTCVEVVGCSRQQRLTVGGTAKSTRPKSDKRLRLA